MTGRLTCIVPFCRRTSANTRFDEWICGPHWRLVPRWLKGRKNRAYRLVSKVRRRQRSTYRQILAAQRLASRIWTRCKVAAIERAAGITA